MKNYYEGNEAAHLMGVTYRNSYNQMPLGECRKVIDCIKKSTDPNTIKEGFSLLLKEQPILNFNWGPGQEFWRCRKSDNGIIYTNSKDFYCPSPEKIKAPGRLNGVGVPLLYMSTKRTTAYSELRAQPGDILYTICYKIREEKTVRIRLIGELFHVYRTGLSMINPSVAGIVHELMNNSFAYDIWKSILFVDAFLMTVFREKMRKVMITCALEFYMT